MPKLDHLGIAEIIFIVGGIVFIFNLLAGFLKRGAIARLDGVGLMVLGLGLHVLLAL